MSEVPVMLAWPVCVLQGRHCIDKELYSDYNKCTAPHCGCRQVHAMQVFLTLCCTPATDISLCDTAAPLCCKNVLKSFVQQALQVVLAMRWH